MSRRILTAVLVPLLLLGSGGAAQTVRVTDGDTLWVGDERVRLWGIDAPEADTPEGNGCDQASERARRLPPAGRPRLHEALPGPPRPHRGALPET